MKVLLNYDGDNYPAATGHFVRRALLDLGHEIVTENPNVVLNIDGCTQFITLPGVKTVYWEIDSYLHLGRSGDRYAAADLLFLATMEPERMAQHGYPAKAEFLPVAFDRDLHKPHDVEKEFDIIFVGRTDGGYNGRLGLLEKLAQKYKVFWTQSNEDYARHMSRGKLIFNKSHSTEINSRFFEGMAIGALLTDYLGIMDTVATANKHYIPYLGELDLFRQVARYLADDEARKKIAEEGRAHALAHHTFHHRVEHIMRRVADLYV